MTALAEPTNRRERKAHRKAVTAAAERPARSSATLQALTAAAVNVRVTREMGNVRWGATDWQAELWLHFRTCPEFQQAVGIGANNLSRARLIGVEIDQVTGEPGTQPTTNPDVQDVMGQLFGGPTGHGQALAAMKRHLDVAGDCWVFATDSPEQTATTWEVLSTGDVTATSGSRTIQVRQMDDVFRPVDTDAELLVRVWRPAPDRRWEAFSSAQALLPVLRELAALSAMVSSTVKSRLASAGILWLPDDIVLPPANATGLTTNGQVQETAAGLANAWLDVLTESMTTPIKDPDSAAAVVPLVATVRPDSIAKISHMEFGRDLDATIQPLREACIRRIAVGTNAPAELLLGLGDANHWTAWAITEDFARAYLAPDLELICDALTRYYLRPALRARGIDPSAYAIYFDLDKLVPKQISIENATAAYQAGLLSEVEYMEALGFSKTQMATAAERGRRLIVQLITGGYGDTLAAMVPVLSAMFPGMAAPEVPQLPAAPVRETVTEAAPAGTTMAPPALTPPPAGVPAGADGT